MIKHPTTPRPFALVLAAGLASLVGIAACAPMEPVPGAVPAPPGAIVLTNADVSGIFLQASRAEIQRAELAMQRAEHARVREFAERVRTDHHQAMQTLQAINARRGIAPTHPDMARDLENVGQQTVEALGAWSGPDFDRQYIAAQISMTEWTLQLLDQALIPSATDPELRQYLMDVRPTLSSHVQQARQIQAQIGAPPQAR